MGHPGVEKYHRELAFCFRGRGDGAPEHRSVGAPERRSAGAHEEDEGDKGRQQREIVIDNKQRALVFQNKEYMKNRLKIEAVKTHVIV